MPLYDWRCEKCGKTFEAMASYEEAMASTSPQGMTRLQHGNRKGGRCDGRVVYQPAFHLHGEKPVLGAIMSDGRHVPGHFGKEAKRNKKKR